MARNFKSGTNLGVCEELMWTEIDQIVFTHTAILPGDLSHLKRKRKTR
jgi:hypothetical protein